jgi:uncharacterized membrane protein
MIDYKMYRLGKAMKEVSTWYWLSLFLFFLIFPPFILLVKYIQYLLVLNDVRSEVKSEELNASISWQISSMVILIIMPLYSIVAAAISSPANLNLYAAFLALCSLVVVWFMIIISFHEMSAWAESYLKIRNTPNINQFVQGIKSIRLGTILEVVLIGILLVPMGWSKAGDGLMKEFAGAAIPENTSGNQAISPAIGGSTPQLPPPNMHQAPIAQATNQSQNAIPPARAIPAINQNVQNAGSTVFCQHCGATLVKSSSKFCGKCGKPL